MYLYSNINLNMNNKKTRKETAAVVYKKIDAALEDLKGHVKQKKFDKKLQKASNMLAADIIGAEKKAAQKLKKKKKAIEKSAKKGGAKKKGKNMPASLPGANGMPGQHADQILQEAKP